MFYVIQNYTYGNLRLLEKVFEFTYQLIEDSTVLDNSISGAILNGVKRWLSGKDVNTFYQLTFFIKEMHTVRKDAAESLLYNDKICFMNRYIPHPARPSQLYFYHDISYSPIPLSRFGHAEKVEMSTNNKLPCIILMEETKSEILDELLLACAEMNQPVQTLWLNVWGAETLLSDNTGNGSVCTEQALTFTLKAIVYIRAMDFRLRSMRMVMESLKACTSLEEFSLMWGTHVPDELYTTLGQMRELKVLRIAQEQVPPALCSCISQLKHLEVVVLGFIQCSSKTCVSLLHNLRTCPLRKLNLGFTPFTGVFADAFEEGALRHEHLEELNMYDAGLNMDDLHAIRKMINAGQTPRLKVLSLWSSMEMCDREHLVSLLETIDNKLPSCVLGLFRSDLPSNFDPKQYERLSVFNW